MKIGLFSDPHYCQSDDVGGDRRAKLSYEKTKIAMTKFKEAGVEICFCLGDLTDNAKEDTREISKANLKEMMCLINSFGIPFYLVPGNHDFLLLKREDLNAENIDTPPYVIETKEYNFIVLDANYRSDFEHFDTAGVVWYDSNLPPFQCEFLKNALEESQKPCIVLVHENLDPTVEHQCIIKNHEEIKNIIDQSKKVKMVIQGHHHEGSYLKINGIPYLTVKGMCQGEEIPFEILDI